MRLRLVRCQYQIVGPKHRYQKCCVCAERSESHHKVMATKLKQACSIIHFSIRLKIQSSDGLPIFRWRCVVPKHQSFVALLFFYYSIHQIVYGLWVQRSKMRHTQSTIGFKMGLSEREKNVQWKQIGYVIKQKAVAQSNEKKNVLNKWWKCLFFDLFFTNCLPYYDEMIFSLYARTNCMDWHE